MHAYEEYTYEVYTRGFDFRKFDLSLTNPMSCRTNQHYPLLRDMRWCVMVPPNGSGTIQPSHPRRWCLLCLGNFVYLKSSIPHRFNQHTSPSTHYDDIGWEGILEFQILGFLGLFVTLPHCTPPRILFGKIFELSLSIPRRMPGQGVVGPTNPC